MIEGSGGGGGIGARGGCGRVVWSEGKFVVKGVKDDGEKKKGTKRVNGWYP